MADTQNNIHKIDAAGQVPGRVATQVAVLLMGKNRADYAKNRIPEIQVVVENARGLKIDQKKLTDKTYARHSGYPGGLKVESVEEVVAKKGKKEVLRKAIYGMLPKNKLRPQMMKHLTITE